VTRVALVADRSSTELFADGPLLLAALKDVGIAAEIVPWGNGTHWAAFDAALIRTTWDYILDREAFLDWAARVSTLTRLANSVEVLQWNTDKRYLRDLEAAGVATVPTMWVDRGEAVPVVEWDDFVVKPSISAGARLSARYRRGDDPSDHIRDIHAIGAVAMIQPYVPSVDKEGETGTYVFGGRVSHAIRKGTILESSRPPSHDLADASLESVRPTLVDPELSGFALRVLETAPPVLYARVDTAPGVDGQPILLELELTEPYLFLALAPHGAGNFARAVASWLK